MSKLIETLEIKDICIIDLRKTYALFADSVFTQSHNVRNSK